MGGIGYFILALIVFAISQAARILTDWWLGMWTQDKYNLTNEDYIGAYAGLAISSSVFYAIRYTTFIKFSVRISKSIFMKLLDHLLKAPMSFFDATPLGRITSRFT